MAVAGISAFFAKIAAAAGVTGLTGATGVPEVAEAAGAVGTAVAVTGTAGSAAGVAAGAEAGLFRSACWLEGGSAAQVDRDEPRHIASVMVKSFDFELMGILL